MDILITKSANTPVINYQSFKKKIIPIFEKYDEVAFNHLNKNLISALKNHIVSLKNEILFLKKEIETKKPQLISTLI